MNSPRSPLPVATLYRQVFRIAEGRSEKPPSYGVVYDILRRLAADWVTLAHDLFSAGV
jgi:hypothetical protein